MISGRDFGSYDDYKSAAERGMSSAQWARYKAKQDACRSNWNAHEDNEQLVNNWSGWTMVKVKCKQAAEQSARYGTPEFILAGLQLIF